MRLYILSLMCEDFPIKLYILQLLIKLFLLLLEVCKNNYRKKTHYCWQQQARQRWTFLTSFKTDLAKLGVSQLLNIHIFNQYKALYLASSSTFQHLDFTRAVQWLRTASPQYILKDTNMSSLLCEILSSISHYGLQA